jgi:hypothetical protein
VSDPVPIRHLPKAVQFTFDLGQRVTIRGTGIEADVVAQIANERGEMYEIIFWTSQGQRISSAVFTRELKAKD